MAGSTSPIAEAAIDAPRVCPTCRVVSIIPDAKPRFSRGIEFIITAVFTFWNMALPIAAMQAAYGECQTWLDETVSYLQANRDFLYENLWEIPGIDLVNPEGTYFLWIDFSKTGFNDPYTVLCEAGVELSNGDAFGDSSYLRLNFASPRARLEKALSRLRTLFG